MTEKESKELPPKLFISYSWTTPEHEDWVLRLATELCESGVDVLLDKWDLREGQDAFDFMEKMVKDPEISKVIMVTDKAYAEKADDRTGGVGTETQIISKEVYDKVSQKKFVAIIPSKDETGKPYLPVYYKSRIYIDLSEEDIYAKNFETLLRWIFDKPLHTKPEIGKAPSFLDKEPGISLGATALFRRTNDALKNDKSYKYGALNEYLDTFSTNLERFRIEQHEGEYDEALIENIKSFLPHRNEYIQLLSIIAQYSPNPEAIQLVHKFFEGLIRYYYPPKDGPGGGLVCRFDNFKFIVHELFLYTIAILVEHELFNLANLLLEEFYFVRDPRRSNADSLSHYSVIRKNLESLEYRKHRLKLNRISVHADLLKERCVGTGVDFNSIMQADFLLYIKTFARYSWWPETLVYASDHYGPFEIFARATSRRYFDKMKCLLGVESAAELSEQITKFLNEGGRFPNIRHTFPDPEALLGIERLASLP
ncbi:TIR domain-containing protein [Gimesia chilikensis]|uniref:SEFIR domain-containing protein n=1 Tax=Gimesia chilikensis TaxID=2605989 RepID=UPI0011EE29FA|nr:SEFIR domain-containing protein [Gimesia chilikensis]KAA0132086.1 TIR domain-containing protein [Gimesia chilikensis]